MTFHVILPISLWEWDENSCMHIVLDDNNLAKKPEGLGDFSLT